MPELVVESLFAWSGPIDAPDDFGGLAGLDKARVTQCALSRICGVCAQTLGRPIVFVGTPAEVARNAFHAPPLHAACAATLQARPDADPEWVRVSTAGFEFVRPGGEDADRRPTFAPNSLL